MNTEISSSQSDDIDSSKNTEHGAKRSDGNENADSSIWLRLVFMVLVSIIYGISRAVVALVVLVQFVHVLCTGKTNDSVLELSESLATYTYQIIRYLTFGSERRPYPFDREWPTGSPNTEH